MQNRRMLTLGVVLVLAFAGIPFIPGAVDNYLFFFLFLVFVNITLSQSWNLVAGYTGQISLAQHAFFGIGGYATAIISNTVLSGGHFYFNPGTMLASGLVAALFGVIIGTPLLSKLAGDYFALGTLGFGEIIRVILVKGGSATGGSFGISMSSEPFQTLTPHYWVGLLFALGSTALVYVIVRSRMGLALMAIREDQLAAAANGVNVLFYKVAAFAIGGFLAGLAGSLYAFYVFSVSPGGFLSLNWTLYPILMCVMGGSGTILGPVVGAFVMTAVFSAANVWLPSIHPIFSGALIIVVMLFMPNGILRMRGARGGAQRGAQEGLAPAKSK